MKHFDPVHRWLQSSAYFYLPVPQGTSPYIREEKDLGLGTSATWTCGLASESRRRQRTSCSSQTSERKWTTPSTGDEKKLSRTLSSTAALSLQTKNTKKKSMNSCKIWGT
jgi:hypothetical protein